MAARIWILVLLMLLIVWSAIHYCRINDIESRVAELELAEEVPAVLLDRIKKGNATIADLGAACIAMAKHIEKSERIIAGELSDVSKGPAVGIGGE